MEIAFISANKLMLELEKKQGLFSARIIAFFLKNPGKYLITMLIGNNVALVVYGITMAKILEPLIENMTDSPIAVLTIQTIISTLLILITAEFLPKTIFRSNPNFFLNIFSIPVSLFYFLFYPITQFIEWLSKLLLGNVLSSDEDTKPLQQAFDKVDLVHLINQAKDENLDVDGEENDLKLFQNALDFSNVKLRDCMIPRTEIIAMDVNTPIEELKNKFIETGYSKILISENSMDNIIGYITSKELFKNIKKIKSHLISVSYVPETMAANKLLTQFIQEQKGIAIVVDEFGGIAGMLTIEDIIEEIFGEIEDEHDTSELIEKQVNDNQYIFSGRLEIDHINDKYGINLPESEEYDTIAGLIFYIHRNIPKMNERISVEKFIFKILKVTKTRIELVHLTVSKD
jgi:CBS domain containing-hemolysin-like protein